MRSSDRDLIKYAKDVLLAFTKYERCQELEVVLAKRVDLMTIKIKVD